MKVVDFAPGVAGRGGRRRAHRRGPARPGRRRGRPSRRPALDDRSRRAERRGRDAGTDAGPRHRLRRHRRGRWHLERDHDRPGRRVRRHLPPARPRARARPGATRTSPSSGGPRGAEARAHRAARRREGEPPTPVAIERQILAVERARRGARAIEAVEAAGGTAHWRSATCSTEAVGGIVDEIRRARAIDVLVHAGGLEISRGSREGGQGVRPRLRRQGRRLVQPAAALSGTAPRGDGGVQLGRGPLRQRGPDRLQLGQRSPLQDVVALPATRPGTRGIAIDWTAWGDIGMATRGSIPKIMELAGIDMLPPAAGIPIVRRELVAGGRSRRGRGGRHARHHGRRSGTRPAAWTRRGGQVELAGGTPLALAGLVGAAASTAACASRRRSTRSAQPFLFDHRIDGTPVLPGVMGIEAFAEVAERRCVPASTSPRSRTVVPAALQVLPRRGRPRCTSPRVALAGGDVGEVCWSGAELRSLVQPKPELPAQERVHFRARVRLRRRGRRRRRRVEPFQRPAAKALGIGARPSTGCTSTAPPTRCSRGPGSTATGVVARMATGLPPERTPAGRTPLVAPRLLELVLPDGGAVAARDEGDDGPAHAPRAGGGLPPGGRGEGEAALRRWTRGATARSSTRGSWTRRASSTPRSRGYRTVALPGRAPLAG